MSITIREIQSTDIAQITALYNYFIRDTIITFEEDEISEAEMASRVRSIVDSGQPWLVAELDGAFAGYAYASQWRVRSAYRFAVESTIYCDLSMGRRGLGSALYRALIDRLRENGITTVIGVVGLPNPGSIAIHEKLGFHKAAHLSKVGYKFERWLDVGYWQKELS